MDFGVFAFDYNLRYYIYMFVFGLYNHVLVSWMCLIQ